MRAFVFGLACAACLLAPAVWALDFRSVAVPRAVLFDAPSAQSKKLYVVPQLYPVEVVVELGNWLKVRDVRGDLAWVEARQLAPKRMVLVTSIAEVRAAADPNAKLVFRVEPDVVLELLEPGTDGWAKVRHREGLIGYLPVAKLWGI